ncbi:MAG: 4-alpha-glucanotransferase [Candidatus Sericytochromatia bacterium]|nr:4-alpha-glucanotransferase [Candidatus Sericytochromatia bacterium]
MTHSRLSGILLHPTSLPGGQGIGDLGSAAYAFVDWLAESKQRLWQVLPLGPTGYGDSPYQSFSAFAGNPLLIDLEALVGRGWLAPEALADAPPNTSGVDYGHVVWFKTRALQAAFEGFSAQADEAARADLAGFCKREAGWLDDYALFQALKAAHEGACWNQWPAPLARRERQALAAARRAHAGAIAFHQFCQWTFFTQWSALRAHANAKGIQVVGDVPIFVAFDSADVWQHPDLFHLDDALAPTVVAGVPPDYFSETGQLWGNPLYRWDVLGRRRYGWWIERMRQALTLYDLVRLDHFRGFEAYWEVPAGEPTAVNGRWVRGPGAKLFKALQKALGAELPIIAEDLGLITPEVEALRDAFGLPGMKILEFAFGSPSNAYLPHNHIANCVVYTGTHDNDTARGWYDTAPEEEKAYACRYLQTDAAGFTGALVRAAFASVARIAIVPVPDLLGLGAEARMNTPGAPAGNWTWRLAPGQIPPEMAIWLAELATTYGRTPEALEPAPPHGAEAIVVHDR